MQSLNLEEIFWTSTTMLLCSESHLPQSLKPPRSEGRSLFEKNFLKNFSEGIGSPDKPMNVDQECNGFKTFFTLLVKVKVCKQWIFYYCCTLKMVIFWLFLDILGCCLSCCKSISLTRVFWERADHYEQNGCQSDEQSFRGVWMVWLESLHLRSYSVFQAQFSFVLPRAIHLYAY